MSTRALTTLIDICHFFLFSSGTCLKLGHYRFLSYCFPINHLPFIDSFINDLRALCWALASPSVSLSFYTDDRTPWTGDQPVARPLPTQRTIQTHDPSVRVREDSSCLRPPGHCDQPLITLGSEFV
jgi:hypothetical protein